MSLLLSRTFVNPTRKLVASATMILVGQLLGIAGPPGSLYDFRYESALVHFGEAKSLSNASVSEMRSANGLEKLFNYLRHQVVEAGLDLSLEACAVSTDYQLLAKLADTAE